jgi:hypothetical protein
VMIPVNIERYFRRVWGVLATWGVS